MAKTKKKSKRVESAVFYISLLLENKEIKRIYSYCRAYIHLGKAKQLPDLFNCVRDYLPRYKKCDLSLFSHSELLENYQILERVYDNLF